MNKQDALNRLSALESEAKALREIIEAPEKAAGLWRPEQGKEYYCVREDGPNASVVHKGNWIQETTDAEHDFGNCFPSREIAEKAAPLMARANKIIAAALQADPDAGEFVRGERAYTVIHCDGEWKPDSWSDTYSIIHPAHVHTMEQGMEFARILNAEGVK